jgi:hypothetical protein
MDIGGLSRALLWPGRRSDSDLPDGLFCNLAVQPSLQKYFASPMGSSSFIDSAVHPTEGRIAIVTDAGLDAMDVGTSGAISYRVDE